MAIRVVGPVSGPTKSYVSESALVRGYGAKAGSATAGATAITAAGQRGVGIVQESVSGAGLPVGIVRHGDAVAIAGVVNLPVQAYVKFDVSGRVVPATTTGDEVIGRTESAGVLVGDEVVVFVNPFIL